MFLKNRGNARRIACIWHEAVSFHGNGCPLLALGVRVCDTALTALEITNPRTENLVCVSEHSGCCVDALQVALHCTTGKRQLLFYKTGKLIFTVYDLQHDRSVRICTQKTIAENIFDTPIEWILSASVNELFYFEEALPLPEYAKKRALHSCQISQAEVPARNAGVWDSTEQFAQFDLPGNGFGNSRRSRR